ncbi:MAG: hypothetical protein ACRETB_13675 [Steroidobacteraceae bacterium]
MKNGVARAGLTAALALPARPPVLPAAALALLCAAFTLAAAASAGAAPAEALAAPAIRHASAIRHAAAGEMVLALPEYIGVLDYMGERTRADRRPGRSYSYRAAGLALDINVYGYDRTRLPDGIASPLVAQELVRVERPLLAAGARLVRTGTVVLEAPGSDAARSGLIAIPPTAARPIAPRPIAPQPITVREAVLARRGAAFTGTSYVWITARRGRLYEMRFDVRAGFEDDGEVSRSESLAALGQAIAHPSPTPSVPPANQVDVAVQWDPATPPAERQLWAAYIYTRAALVAAESGQRALAVGEHIASFDEELRGRLIAVNLYRELQRANPALHSAYFADLARVDAAGYLREYVWRYLRAPSWTRPEGLRLAAFDAWRAVHLLHHTAETYGRIDIVPLAPAAHPAAGRSLRAQAG